MGVGANRINLILVCDKSGSMAGSRWDGVRRGVHQAVGELTSGDIVTIVTFNESVDVIGPSTKASTDMAAFDRVRPSGGTALYDATLAALKAALQLHVAVDVTDALTVLTYVVVMTDGEDTHSSSTLMDVCSILERVNTLRGFKIIFAGASLPPAGRSAMQRMAAVGDRDIQFMDLNDGSFRGVFEHLKLTLQRRG